MRSKTTQIDAKSVADALAIAALVFAACVIGIQTRLLFSLASIWPANAVLLGLLLLRPGANNALTWILSAAGYVAADLVTGSSLENALLLNAANLLGISAGIALMQARVEGARFFSRPLDVITTISVIAVASAFTAVVGALIGPLLFDMDWVASFGLWFSAELVNYTIFLPVLLALLIEDQNKLRLFARNAQQFRQQLAALAILSFSIVMMHWIGGPGAPSYVVPGLLWCAVCFRPFACAILTMLTCVWILIAGPLELISLNASLDHAIDASSFRLGVGMVATGTLAVSIINSAWRDAHGKLKYVASHDALTGLLNRGAFLGGLTSAVEGGQLSQITLLTIDVDHFKVVNDTHGHPSGDAVLRTVGRILRDSVRPNDLCGRVGGEEFAVLVRGAARKEGILVAERIHKAMSDAVTSSQADAEIRVTLSIGVCDAADYADLESLLAACDRALYSAKNGGRNQIVFANAIPGNLARAASFGGA